MSITLNRATIDLLTSGDLPCPVDFAVTLKRDRVMDDGATWEGGELWTFQHAGGTGTAMRGPGGDGAMEHGAGAEWGTWAVEEGGLVFTATDSGVKYDAQGVEIVGEASDGEWIDCGALEYGRVSARLDGDRVRISYTATDPECGDDDHLIREAVEAKLGLWIKTPSAHHWSAAEGDWEVVQTVSRLEHQPTHEIDHGGITLRVCLIEGSAYARVELEFDEGADWTVNDGGEWLFQGQRVGGSVRTL